MISVAAALELIGQHRPDLGAEEIQLQNAVGRILQDDIFARFTAPAVATSVMDGYAFRKEDIHRDMTVIGESRAGKPYDGDVGEREAIRIFTGAQIPPNLNHVEIQEYAVRDGKRLTFSKLSQGRDYVRPRGSLFERGERLFGAGETVTPAIISVLASANVASVKVKRVPRIAVLRCGDELRPLGSVLTGAQIVDSNGPYLISCLTQWGYETLDLGMVADDPDSIEQVVSECSADIILAVGGASVGKYDFMKAACLGAGFERIFETVAVKPGKPVWLSKKSEQIVLGLPGNPGSVFVCSHIFLTHLLGRSAQWASYTLAGDLAENGVRENYIPACYDKDGHVLPLTSKTGSARIFAEADVLVQRKPFAAKLRAGGQVDCLKLSVSIPDEGLNRGF